MLGAAPIADGPRYEVHPARSDTPKSEQSMRLGRCGCDILPPSFSASRMKHVAAGCICRIYRRYGEKLEGRKRNGALFSRGDGGMRLRARKEHAGRRCAHGSCARQGGEDTRREKILPGVSEWGVYRLFFSLCASMGKSTRILYVRCAGRFKMGMPVRSVMPSSAAHTASQEGPIKENHTLYA